MAYPTDTEKDKLDQNGAAPLQKAATPQAPKPVADTAPAAQNALLAPNPTDQRLAAGTATPPANPTSAPPAPNQGLIPQGANYGPAGQNPLMRANSAPSEPAKMGDNMSAVLSENQKDVQAHRQAGNTAAAIGASVRGDLAMVPAFLADTGAAIAKDAAPAANAISRFASSLFGGDGKSDIGAATPAKQPAQQPAVTMPATTTNPTDQRLAAGTQAPPMDPEAQATANPLTGWDRGKMTNADVAAANPAGQVRAVRGANGVMEFSGSNVSGPVSYADAQGNAIAGQGIEGKGWGGGVTSMPGRGFSPSTATSSALSGALSDAVARGDMDAVQRYYFSRGQSFGGKTEQQVRADNLMAQAQNLMNRGHVGDAQKAQMLLSTLGTMEQNANTARGFDVQRDMANTRNAIDQGKLELDQKARGFDFRVAERQEELYQRYQNAKTPEERNAIAQQIRDLKGTAAPASWKAVALQGGTDAMGNKTEGVLAAVNEQTGEVRRLDSGQGGAPVPIDKNPKALAIKNDATMSRDQKAAELKKLGYQ